jgi:hypothetical protein
MNRIWRGCKIFMSVLRWVLLLYNNIRASRTYRKWWSSIGLWGISQKYKPTWQGKSVKIKGELSLAMWKKDDCWLEGRMIQVWSGSVSTSRGKDQKAIETINRFVFIQIHMWRFPKMGGAPKSSKLDAKVHGVQPWMPNVGAWPTQIRALRSKFSHGFLICLAGCWGEYCLRYLRSIFWRARLGISGYAIAFWGKFDSYFQNWTKGNLQDPPDIWR